MKKILSAMMVLITIILCSETLTAQNRTKVADGVYIALYGNVAVIENDNTQQSIQIKVVKSDNLYDVICGDTVLKRVAKEGLKEAINKAFEYAGLDGWATKSVVGYYVDKYYQQACDFFGR